MSRQNKEEKMSVPRIANLEDRVKTLENIIESDLQEDRVDRIEDRISALESRLEAILGWVRAQQDHAIEALKALRR